MCCEDDGVGGFAVALEGGGELSGERVGMWVGGGGLRGVGGGRRGGRGGDVVVSGMRSGDWAPDGVQAAQASVAARWRGVGGEELGLDECPRGGGGGKGEGGGAGG